MLVAVGYSELPNLQLVISLVPGFRNKLMLSYSNTDFVVKHVIAYTI